MAGGMPEILPAEKLCVRQFHWRISGMFLSAINGQVDSDGQATRPPSGLLPVSSASVPALPSMSLHAWWSSMSSVILWLSHW